MIQLHFLNESEYQADEALFTPYLLRLESVIPNLLYTEVELLLTDNAQIRELNKTYRGKDAPTDVLSFSLADEKRLGQIVISVERAEEQAEELGQALQDELQFLFVHGLLHLLGYDHETPEEEAQMLNKAYTLLGRKKD